MELQEWREVFKYFKVCVGSILYMNDCAIPVFQQYWKIES